MKHCPKCGRTFPDESQKFCTVDGGVLIGEATLDPNATVRVNPADLEMLMPQVRRDKVAKSGKPAEIQKPEVPKAPEPQKAPDLGATLYAPAGSPPPSVAPPPPKNVPNSAPAVSAASSGRFTRGGCRRSRLKWLLISNRQIAQSQLKSWASPR